MARSHLIFILQNIVYQIIRLRLLDVIKVCMEKNKVRLEMLRMEFSTEIVLLQTVQHVSIRSTSALR